ncbi:hypothetical protein K933_15084 [Candidatus Halobonum tyrrellensis G22]|uniref:Uncharacterized protein n=1 Tax=Candidatus Halobonum tyrrellensis G22 TaxID=1324957 RepID=V4H908_9EURY|nr:hypothetical protein K933_15084 [Candidatus Halobonum tyrrellensis G22]
MLARLRSEHPTAAVRTGELLTNAGAEERIRLRHSLLPVLAEADLVCWDRERDLVSRGPEFDAALPFLDLIEERESDSTTRNLPA